jgi:hypothetical protein
VPAVLGSLWGAGVYGLSAAGRARFDVFPDVVADDLWVDRHFASDEVEVVDSPPVVVTVPRRACDLRRTLRRTYRGKHEMADAGDSAVTPPAPARGALRDLCRLAATGPAAAFDAATYALFAVGARAGIALHRTSGNALSTGRWERDDSSRAG